MPLSNQFMPLQELYGAERTSTITAALSRLFTAFLQRFGFTCGVSDVFLVSCKACWCLQGMVGKLALQLVLNKNVVPGVFLAGRSTWCVCRVRAWKRHAAFLRR